MKNVPGKVRLALTPAMLLGMLLALGVSAPSARADQTPTCDGMHCHSDGDCGSKCICNEYEFTCLDNTTALE